MSQYRAKPVPPLADGLKRQLDAIRKLPYGLKGFRKFSKLLVLPSGKPFKLQGFQDFMLALHFAGVIELVILIPKKNGKTTLLAALALYHLFMVQSAYVAIGAGSRDQATYIFDQAVGFVSQSKLEAVFDVKGGYRLIRLRDSLSRIRVLAGDADTGDGVIPTLALVDELHRHRDGELYGTFRNGLEGEQDAQMITISTAGASVDSPLGRLLELAKQWPMEQVKRRRVFQAPHRAFALVEWALDPDDDFSDIRLVKDVNPAPWHTLAKLARRHMTNTPGEWLRFACGIWTAGEEPEILPRDWDPLYADIGGVVDGDEVVLAPSVGHNAVIGIAAYRPDGKVAVRAEHLEPGGSILARTEDVIVDLCDRYAVLKVLDPGYGMQRSMELVEGRGVPVESAAYSTPRQIAASGAFDRFLRAGDLIHDGDPKTRAHVLAAIKKVGTMGEHYIASDETRAIVAISQAVYSITAFDPEPYIGLPSVMA